MLLTFVTLMTMSYLVLLARLILSLIDLLIILCYLIAIWLTALLLRALVGKTRALLLVLTSIFLPDSSVTDLLPPHRSVEQKRRNGSSRP